MSTVEQARAIIEALPQWGELDTLQRAEQVIDWCKKSRIECASLLPVGLQVAMSQIPCANQGPENYLDFVQAYHAAHIAHHAYIVPLVGILLEDYGPTR
jgi:hypothetical protein